MDKFAQRRSLLNKIHEKGNLWGKTLEKFINPQFESIMDQLREFTDDPVRAVLLGESVGRYTPDVFGFKNPGIKTLIDNAISNFNEIEYVKCIIDLDKFNTVMGKAVPILISFDQSIDDAHKEFLWKGIEDKQDPETIKYLEHMKSRTAHARNNQIIKNATWGSSLHSFLSGIYGRFKSLKDWQKRFPSKTKALKIALSTILDQAKTLLKLTLTRLKAMAKSRAQRNISEYLENASVIIKSYQSFSSNFSKFYNTHFKGFMDERSIPKVEAPAQLAPAPVTSVSQPSSAHIVPDLDMSGVPVRKAPTLISEPISLIEPATSERPTDPGATKEVVKDTVKMESAPTKKKPVEKRVVSPIKSPSSPLPQQTLLPATLLPAVDLSVEKTKEEPKKPGPPEGVPTFGSMSPKHFIESLETLSNENPIVLANHIAKYATKIQKTNPKLAYQLTIIIDKIVG